MKDGTQASMDKVTNAARIISALDSNLRMAILLLLSERDHVVHELVSTLNKSQPLISQHLRVLKKVGLVSSKRMGREVVYTLAVPEAIQLINDADAVAHKADNPDELAERREKRTNETAGQAATPAAFFGAPDDESTSRDPGLEPNTPHPRP
ncbi:metalloregulator ArsR/SmtB family transcription factor [Corynebacterium breve]|uniref:Metalloregulator ArsR/SmtB family transcription factor n=1 Tax=Corynebacterium breve TaxID=3049799 RepID=A0ABY8VBM6_9CORY|nr:metalloregulator ArsR/SmtB family transcription factor [Corynebacterium breve]WIM67076.1 metalloregulator ArsR/SmtB family transcription factor [Corynebacterium breve]